MHEWVEDGHKVHIRWESDQILVDRIECPFEGSNAFCNRMRNYCVVQRFVGVFGAETNVGTTQVLGPVEIAWLGVPGDSDLDDELGGVWITPINDPEYIIFKNNKETIE